MTNRFMWIVTKMLLALLDIQLKKQGLSQNAIDSKTLVKEATSFCKDCRTGGQGRMF